MSSGVFGKGSSEGLCMLWGEREMVWMTQLQSCKVITVCSLLKNTVISSIKFCCKTILKQPRNLKVY